jgi:hypothetical protein
MIPMNEHCRVRAGIALFCRKRCALAVIVIRKTSIRNSNFRRRALPVSIKVCPEILFVCRSGFAARSIVTLLKCAEYSVAHAETKLEAMGWLSRRPFGAMIVDCSVPENHDLQTQAELKGVPVIIVARRRNEDTSAGMTVFGVKKLLTAFSR